jgi:hypothetical protein
VVENWSDGKGVVSPPVQGATVLHRLARLNETAIQGATQGATFSKTHREMSDI